MTYGLPLHFDPTEQDDDRAGYANANTFHHAGCVVQEWTRALVLYCPECRSARKGAQDG